MRLTTIILVLYASCFSQAQTLNLNKKSWQATGWKFKNGSIIGDSKIGLSNTGGLSFDFQQPTQAGTSTVNYLVTTQLRAISGSLTASYQVAASGDAVFSWQTEVGNTCPAPASARLYFERPSTGSEFDRWWATPTSYVLAPGTAMMTVPLTPDQWSSTYGKLGNADPEATAAFEDALNNVGHVGLSFGGGCFFGHGAYMSDGTASFTVTGFSVTP